MLPGDYTGTWNSPFKAPKPRALLRVVRRANDKKRWIQWIQWKRPQPPHRHHDPPYRIEVSNALGAIHASAVEWPGAALSPECALGYLFRRPAQNATWAHWKQSNKTMPGVYGEARSGSCKSDDRAVAAAVGSPLVPTAEYRQLGRPLFSRLSDASTAKPFSVC
jgi:hypothetical protein